MAKKFADTEQVRLFGVEDREGARDAGRKTGEKEVFPDEREDLCKAFQHGLFFGLFQRSGKAQRRGAFGLSRIPDGEGNRRGTERTKQLFHQWFVWRLIMKNCKVYKDGSHYIAIRPTEGAGRDRRVLPPEECIIVDESSDVTDSMPVAVQDETIQAEEGQTVMSELSPDEKPEKKFRISTRTDEFLRWYRASVGMKKSEQYRFIASKLAPYFTSQEDLYYFLDKKMYCRKRAETTRRIRCLRRAALHELNYFCTVT